MLEKKDCVIDICFATGSAILTKLELQLHNPINAFELYK